MPTRHILMVSSEAVPFAKTGGLGDVAGALPLALARLGHRVTLVLPRYRDTGDGERGGPGADHPGRAHATRRRSSSTRSPRGPAPCWSIAPSCTTGRSSTAPGTTTIPTTPSASRSSSRAALEFAARAADERPDVVHAHDWQAGLAPVYLQHPLAAHPALGGAATVFTIHNLAYQGLFPPHWLPALDLGWELFGIDGLEFWGRVSFLKGGINFSDIDHDGQPAVRQGDPDAGVRLRLRRDPPPARRAGWSASSTASTRTTWNPATDPHLPGRSAPTTLEGKRAAKRALLEAMGLPSPPDALARPLVGMVSRLVDQKGFDLLAELARRSCSRSMPRACCSAAARPLRGDVAAAGRRAPRPGRRCGSASTSGWRTSSRPAPTSS